MATTGLDVEAIKDEFEMTLWEEEAWDPDRLVRRVFLGTVFQLLPSGKYYMPWARSNVDPCTVCGGNGSVGGHRKRRVQERALKRNAAMLRQALRRWGPGSERVRQDYKRRKRCARFLPRECPHCGGVGSREAYLDQLWTEEVEDELAKIGASLVSGEGDPCDLYAEQHKEKEVEDVEHEDRDAV